jgi:hypothetical protein
LDGRRRAERLPLEGMIEHQRETYDGHYTFLGANQGAFAEAGGLGMGRRCHGPEAIRGPIHRFCAILR